MSNDFSPIEPTDNEAPMFAGVPSWERGKKRRGLGARVAAEPRSFGPEFAAEPPIPTRPVTLSDGATAYEARMDTVDPTDTSFASGATFADRTTRKGNGAATIMVAAGIILVGGLAAGGWYALQPHNTGVAELTPGSPATTTTTQVAQTMPAPSGLQIAQNTVQTPPAAPVRSKTITTTTHVPKGAVSQTTVTHARPARSAADAGANASTTAAAPRAPMPAAPPAAAAPPAPLVLVIPPTTAAPAEAPLPTQTAPAPAPTQTPPN